MRIEVGGIVKSYLILIGITNQNHGKYYKITLKFTHKISLIDSSDNDKYAGSETLVIGNYMPSPTPGTN